MSPDRRKSPWAFDENNIQCPNCKSTRVVRVINSWALARGIQTFKCSACGRVFYDRDVDDYQPTFER